MKNSRFLGSAVEGDSSSRHRRHYGAHDHIMYGPRPILKEERGLTDIGCCRSSFVTLSKVVIQTKVTGGCTCGISFTPF